MLSLLKMTIALTVAISATAFADPGGNSGGGGDTDASSFVTYAKQIAYWAGKHPELIAPNDATELNRIATKIDKDMDGSVKAPVAFSKDGILIDRFGTPKMGAFQNTGSISIRISRPRWELLSIVSRYKLAALELFGLAGVERRYSTASLVEANFTDIAGRYTYSNIETQLLSSPVLRSLYERKSDEWADGMFIFTKMTAYGGVSLSGSVLHGYQRKVDSDFEDAAEEFRALPKQVLFDILISGVARYTKQPRKTSWGFTEVNGTVVPSERYGYYLNRYIGQLGYLMKDYQERSASLSTKQKAELQNIAEMIAQAYKMVDASYVAADKETGKITMLVTKSPFTEYFDGAINKMRRTVVDEKCSVPSTYTLDFNKRYVAPRITNGAARPLADLNGLKKTALENSSHLQSLLSTISTRWTALVENANLNAIKIAYGHSEADETSSLMDIAYMIATHLEKSAQQDIELTEDLVRLTDSDDLCVKL